MAFENWYDYTMPGAAWEGLKYAKNKAGGVMDWMGKRNAPQIGENPYMSDWGSLLKQLKGTADGTGMQGSVALGAYQQAHNQGVRDQASMAAGGSAGQVRQAGMNVARMNQGLQQGYSNARLQEQLAAPQSLQGALTNAGNAWFQPQQANLQAQMNTPTNGQQMMQFLQQLFAGGASIAGK
jgi:hypothetical protein